LAAGWYGAWIGLGGRPLAAALSVFSFLLLVMLLFAARGVTEKIVARLGSAAGILLGGSLLLAYLIYLLGTNTFAIARAGVVMALILAPLALALSAERKPAGAWQDFLIVAGVWACAKFLPAAWLWPYASGKPAHIFTILLMVAIGIAVFLLTRRVSGVDYNIGWGANWLLYIIGSFLLFAVIAIPLGMAIHFVQFAPSWKAAGSLPLVAVGILIFTAWPEEFLFRGLLQNMLSQRLRSDFAAILLASVLFGLSHITNGHTPNWRYAALASIAGLFYGWVWRKTGSIFASAMVHALVDATWHFFFRTL
jgi:membrane protease YdiL (CAAX protease family)